MKSKPLTVVCGPTATGKTKYALTLAKENNGELISADSRQLYKYLDIGTGKDLPKNAKFEVQKSKFGIKQGTCSVGYYLFDNVPLWLYDMIAPDQTFSAYEYGLLAQGVINDVWKRDKLPILVGGTGLYIQAAVDGLDKNSPPNWKLREQLSKQTVEQLQNTLTSLTFQAFEMMNNSDKNNPRRLVRVIEKAQNIKTTQTELRPLTKNVRFVGLGLPKEKLAERINTRVEKRVSQGMVKEAKQLLEKGYTWDDPGLNTLGYKQLRVYFEKKETLEESVRKWKQAELTYARRQITWFNKDKRIRWITV